MGMYDDIVCKYPLPLPEDTKGYTVKQFQSKDLECCLGQYEIREDGTLWLRECDYEVVGGDPNGKTFSQQFETVKEIKVWWTQVKSTQTIRMYDYCHNNDGSYDYYVEFEVVFIDGVINKVTLIKFEAIDNAERKEDNRKFIAELKKRRDFELTLFYRYFGRPYNKVIRFIVRQMYVIGAFMTSVCWKLEKKITI